MTIKYVLDFDDKSKCAWIDAQNNVWNFSVSKK